MADNITLEEIKYAEGQVSILKLKLDDAENLVNKLKTKYINDHAKYKIGDICVWSNSITNEVGKDLITIIAPNMLDNGKIQYLCNKNGLYLIISEENLILYVCKCS